MSRFINLKYPEKDIKIIYPAVDLDIFKPTTKENIVLIPSTTAHIPTLNYRYTLDYIDLFKEHKLKSKIITRGEVGQHLIKQNIHLSKVIDKILSDKELSKELSNVKVIPLIYQKEETDVPLSAIEGLACGCAIICSGNIGLSNLISRNKAGIVTDKLNIKDINKIFNNESYNLNARKLAEEHFNIKETIKQYQEILN